MKKDEFNEKMLQVAALAAKAADAIPDSALQLIDKTESCWIFHFISMRMPSQVIFAWLDEEGQPQWGFHYA